MEKKELSRIRLWLFDLDGTLYLGERIFSFTGPLLDAIRKSGGKYLFLTNNSSRSVEDAVKKLARLGIASAKGDFVTSSQATALYLLRAHPGRRLYICGTESLKAELHAHGFPIAGSWREAEAVVVGFDTELTFRKLEDVCRLLAARPELPYIATNPDLVCPVEFGSVPDCGSICAMLRNATGREPLVIGKPSPLMVELAMERWGFAPGETAVVGDRLYTDIRCARSAGVTGIAVLSGETDRQMLAESPDVPDLVLQNAGEIIPYLKG